MTDLVPLPVAAVVPVALSDGSDIPALASWLVSEEGRRHSGVCQWINFLAAHYAQFRIIQELFPKLNPGRQSTKDWFCMATSPGEMLVIANQLFILRSYGIEGSVLECGCYKGYSSCCLSISCRRLGYPLVIADSFAGLPADLNEVGDDRYYQVGDFAAHGSRSSKTYAPSEIPSTWSWWKAGSRTPSRGGPASRLAVAGCRSLVIYHGCTESLPARAQPQGGDFLARIPTGIYQRFEDHWDKGSGRCIRPSHAEGGSRLQGRLLEGELGNRGPADLT